MSEKPIISGFNQLASLAIQKYERYLPTAFDESMSILQKMNKIIEHLNDIGMITNDLIEQWNTVMEWVLNDGLNASVNAKLDAMVADGTFNQIINVELLGTLSELKTTKKDNLVNAINDNHHKILETGGYGVISGLQVKAQATPNMSVLVEGGTIHTQDGKRFTISEINSLPVTTADPSSNRVDIVYIDSLGVVTYLNGDLSGFPPTTPTGGFKLAEIRVNAGVVLITNSIIDDKRLMKQNNNVIISQLTQNKVDSHKNKNTFTGDLRIAFFYNYEDDQSKVDLLKDLGFNCIYAYKTSNLFYHDVTRTRAFLDRMLASGMYVILGVDDMKLLTAEYADAQAYIIAVEDHPAVIGFHHVDEPVLRGLTRIEQETIYNRIKEVTSKNVFLVDGRYSYKQCRDQYADKACDIYMYDVYLNSNNADGTRKLTFQQMKCTLYKYLIMMNNPFGSLAPKRFIPVLPFYADEPSNVGIITKDELQIYLDVYSLFKNIRDYSIFLFDLIYATGTFTNWLSNTPELQKLCANLVTGIYKNDQEVVTILPNNFSAHRNYVSSENLTYSPTTVDKMTYISQATDPNEKQTLIYKVHTNNRSNELCILTAVFNGRDAFTRSIKHYYSYDGVNFTDCGNALIGQDTFEATNGTDKVTLTTVNKNINCVYVKIEMQLTTETSRVDNSNVGILYSSATFI